MSKKIETPSAFARAFTSGFAGAVRGAAGKDGRLSRSEANNVAEPFRDNAVAFLEHTGQKSVAVDKLIGRAHDYALANAIHAAGADGKLSPVDARALPVDLRAEAATLLAPSANERAREMKALADRISLSVFGEDDSGDFVSFVRRKAKVDALTSDTFLASFGFSKTKQEASDQYELRAMTSEDWENLLHDQPNDDARAAMTRVREVMEPLGTKVVTLEDDRPFGAPVFLVARGPEGELFGFRATIGGMSF